MEHTFLPVEAAAVAANLRKHLARHDAYKEDVKNYGKDAAALKATFADWIDTAGKHWCGHWHNRECHEGGRLGEKCNGHNCGSYMMTRYDDDPNGKAKYDEWFKNDKDCDLVQVFVNTDTNEEIYQKRKKWWSN